MLIDINKIIVNDRIRKDFGNLEELAEDIKTNGLINPPTINKEYVLLAGERRLRACKMLGWNQIPVHMLDTKDEAHDLAVEMSENNLRRNFTGSELAEGIRRQMAIESEKARERMLSGRPSGNISQGSGRASDKAGEAFGISGKQAQKVLFVSDNADLLDPADFAEWDEGKLSTNKAYQRIKAAQRQAEQERDRFKSQRDSAIKSFNELADETEQLEDEVKQLKQQRDEARVLAEKTKSTQAAAIEQRDQAVKDLRKASVVTTNLEMEVESLRQQLAERPEPEVVEREVIREVESEESQRRIRDLERQNAQLNEEYQSMWKKKREADERLRQANELLGENDRTSNARRDIEHLTVATNSYLRNYGGKVWAFDQFDRVDETTQQEFRKAIASLAAFAQNMHQLITENEQ